MALDANEMLLDAARYIENEKPAWAQAAREAVAAARNGWRPIETAPRDGTRMLVTGGGLQDEVEAASYNPVVACWNTESYTLDDRDDEAEGYSRPSHWMPLPAPLHP